MCVEAALYLASIHRRVRQRDLKDAKACSTSCKRESRPPERTPHTGYDVYPRRLGNMMRCSRIIPFRKDR
jgi:hypothetical protein